MVVVEKPRAARVVRRGPSADGGLRRRAPFGQQPLPPYLVGAAGVTVVGRVAGDAEPVKRVETSSYSFWMSASREGWLIQAAVGSLGAVGGRWQGDRWWTRRYSRALL